MLVRRSNGKLPVTMQSFTKLVDKVGDPPAPLDAPGAIPPPGPAAQAWGQPLTVPTLEEVGFTGTPTTIFKVGATCCVGTHRDIYTNIDSCTTHIHMHTPHINSIAYGTLCAFCHWPRHQNSHHQSKLFEKQAHPW